MTVWDSSAVIPLFDPAHPHHAAASELFDGAEEVWLHPCVVREVTTYVRRQAKDRGKDGNRVARGALRALLDQPRVRVAEDFYPDAAVELYLQSAKLSFADACVVALGKAWDMPVIAFDAKLGKAGGRTPRSTARRGS